ncbi:MAG: hypothetical protein JRF25_10855 [Deltaproteobacteria bacterium]|nr:hypothetical protein [Deltaproteobacteria bacterium]
MNRRKAIRQLCIGCSESLKDVRFCEIIECELYPYRMGVGYQDAKARDKAIRKHCLTCCAGSAYEVSKCVIPSCPTFQYKNTALKCKKTAYTSNDKNELILTHMAV